MRCHRRTRGFCAIRLFDVFANHRTHKAHFANKRGCGDGIDDFTPQMHLSISIYQGVDVRVWLTFRRELCAGRYVAPLANSKQRAEIVHCHVRKVLFVQRALFIRRVLGGKIIVIIQFCHPKHINSDKERVPLNR